MGLFGDLLGFNDAGRSAKSISDANIAAEHGILNEYTGDKSAIYDQLGQGKADVNSALAGANEGVNGALAGANTSINQAGRDITGASTSANGTLQTLLDSVKQNAAPSIASGAQGNQALQDYVKSAPKFSFDPAQYFNSPAYNFELQQGANATTNQASASGLSQGGGVLAALTQYGQGLAGKYYNDAFQQQQEQFQTNQNTTLANLQALIASGAQGNQLVSQASQNIGDLQSGNTTGAATQNAGLQQFLGSTNVSGQQGLGALNTNAQLGLGQQGLEGSEAAGKLGLAGSDLAGRFAVDAGAAHAAGITGQGAALSKGVSDASSLALLLAGV